MLIKCTLRLRVWSTNSSPGGTRKRNDSLKVGLRFEGMYEVRPISWPDHSTMTYGLAWPKGSVWNKPRALEEREGRGLEGI